MAPRVCNASSSHAFWAMIIPKSAQVGNTELVSRRHPFGTLLVQPGEEFGVLSILDESRPHPPPTPVGEIWGEVM